MNKLSPLRLTEQALWWIRDVESPKHRPIRAGLVKWLEQVALENISGHEDVAIEALIDMAERCAMKYPDKCPAIAERLYRAADNVAAGRVPEDGR